MRLSKPSKRAKMIKTIITVLLCFVVVLSFGQHTVGSTVVYSKEEIRFLKHLNITGQESGPMHVQNAAIDPIALYRLSKDFIAKDWFQSTIVRFLSTRNKQDELEERIGEIIMRKIELGELDIDIKLSDIINSN